MAFAEETTAGDTALRATDGSGRVADSRDRLARPARRGRVPQRRSVLTRRIVAVNLVALGMLVIGLLHLDDTRDRLLRQHEQGLHDRAELSAELVAARLPLGGPDPAASNDTLWAENALARLALREGTDAYLFDRAGRLRGHRAGDLPRPPPAADRHGTRLTDALAQVWRLASVPFAGPAPAARAADPAARLRAPAGAALAEGAQGHISADRSAAVLRAAAPVMHGATPIGAVVLTDSSGAISRIIRDGRERLLRLILIATLVSVALSLTLAATIAPPLADLAAAAEAGRARDRRPGAGARIPDLTARPDEIGQLSGALRDMVDALTGRIESTGQFAADVAHEIRNPLASLRSAVGTLRITERPEQRARLLGVIEHDVRRLDRLVCDISNASRLDADLVGDTGARVDLVALLQGLAQHLGAEAGRRGIELITDFPVQPIRVTGLEPRLAQVFVNLVTNAISFCEEGDAIRVWVRRRANRGLVVVEDTGPGIPDAALDKIFRRFYSQRPDGEFGNNSGLGLAIARQIVEAHDGVIWAENIRPTQADPTSEPLGARFVVGLPL